MLRIGYFEGHRLAARHRVAMRCQSVAAGVPRAVADRDEPGALEPDASMIVATDSRPLVILPGCAAPSRARTRRRTRSRQAHARRPEPTRSGTRAPGRSGPAG